MTDVDSGTMIEYRDAGKVYASKLGEVTALRAISLSVNRGEFVSIIGQSGCGKSTLLKMTAGVTPVTSGSIQIAGQPVTGPASDLGMVFQTPILLEWRDVISNVLLPLEILGRTSSAAITRARELLELVGLSGFEHRYPAELSGGMQQRVAITRALIIDPPLLLMDEPFGALDALTRDEMAAELLRIWEETRKTILFVTHSIDEAVLLSDRVVVLTPRPGRVGQIVTIDLPRPRPVDVRYDPQFTHLAQTLRNVILDDTRSGEGATPVSAGTTD